MRSARVAAFIALLLATACVKERAQPQRSTTAAPAEVAEPTHSPNLLEFASGASVISRTGELSLDNSAVRAIDGDDSTSWISPPSDTNQTLVFALPARARIDELAIRTSPKDHLHVSTVRVESSLDGSSFSLLATPQLAKTPEIQYFPVTPTEALYLRVDITKATGAYASLSTFQALGRPAQAVTLRSIAGCWTVNGSEAQFTGELSVAGLIREPHPIELHGSREAALYRFAWISGPNWGVAAATVSPDGGHLTEMKWFEWPVEPTFGGSSFGTRQDCRPGAMSGESQFLRTFARRAGAYPLYGLAFGPKDDLDPVPSETTLRAIADLLTHPMSQRVRIIGREYREGTPDENRRRAQVRLDSLRVALQKRQVDVSRLDFVALGSDAPRETVDTGLLRLIYSVMEIEVPAEGR